VADGTLAAARRSLLALVLLALAAVAGAQAPPGDSPASIVPDHEARRDVLVRVLAQPEFQRSGAVVLMEQVRQEIARRLLDLWDRLGGSRLGSRSAATAFAWVVGLLALAALTWWLVQSLARASDRQALRLAPPPARQRTARAWARAAMAAYRAGETREAARCAYRAALARLEEEGEWRQDETRTPREYLRILPSGHRRRPALADLTSRFERTWYGTEAGSPDDARAMLARLEEMGCLASGHAS
jgi:hypothetical protein